VRRELRPVLPPGAQAEASPLGLLQRLHLLLRPWRQLAETLHQLFLLALLTLRAAEQTPLLELFPPLVDAGENLVTHLIEAGSALGSVANLEGVTLG